MADPDHEFDAIVIGEYERAFYGGQYAAMAPLFDTTAASCGLPRPAARSTFRPKITSS
jgi:site-specific DNA recombinase